MFRYERAVRFAEVDAAKIVFFARYLEYCHEAIEALFAGLAGGYSHLTTARDIGVPTVHLEIDFKAPLRYGDVFAVAVDVLRVGNSSITFRHTLTGPPEDRVCAVARHVVVTASMSANAKVPVPADVRALLAQHLVDERVAS